MSYTFDKMLDLPFDAAIDKVKVALAERGFGILTTIDVRTTLKQKIDADFRPYTILGACNPGLAHQALLAEEHIGVMLPCNVVVQAKGDGVEVFAVDPVASMAAVDNASLDAVAGQVSEVMREMVASL